MVNAAWYDDAHRAVRVTLMGSWTWEELYGAIATARELMQEQPDVQTTVLVSFETSVMPRGSLTMHALSAVRSPEPNLAAIIIVSPNRVLYRMMKIMLAMSAELSRRYQVVQSMDEALEAMRERA
jgi:hypothetical protein